MAVNNEVFKFKQFEINQTGCAMKINTDGVLLAASAFHNQPKNILDIGTGTGVIALMLAQRFAEAKVDAVEIDFQAAETAKMNAKQSIFSNRITVYHSAFQNFETDLKYDLIVSNPPFFVNDLRNEQERKGIARHAVEDFFEVLVTKSKSMLSENGSLWLVLPVKQAAKVEKIGDGIGLSVSEKIYIHSDSAKATFRMMICLGKQNANLVERDFYIYESLKVHTQAYKDLLKDFFLNY